MGITQYMLRKYYPQRDVDIFRGIVAGELGCRQQVLDVGCGDGSIFTYDFKEKASLLVGVDLRSDLVENQQVHSASQGSISALPFANETFDLVFSRFVLEHVQDVERAFLELARVLRPRGKLIILTPNLFHYFPLAGRVIPHFMQQQVAGWVGYKSEDTFPTYYRANTVRQLKSLSAASNLELFRIVRHEPCPWFLSFSPLTFGIGTVYERLVNRYDFLAPLRAHLIAIFSKR